MKLKVLVTGVIVVLIAACCVAAVAVSISAQGPAQQQAPQTCSVSGTIVNQFGTGLPGVEVTLHFVNYKDNESHEVGSVTTSTDQQPSAGAFAFNNVTLPAGTTYAYVKAFVQDGEYGIYGMCNNFTVNAGDNITNRFIVMRMPSAVPPMIPTAEPSVANATPSQ